MRVLTALYDRATEAHGQVMTTQTRAEAIRSFRNECNNPQSPLAMHPTDYELRLLGVYDEQTGEIIAEKSTTLARAEDMKGA